MACVKTNRKSLREVRLEAPHTDNKWLDIRATQPGAAEIIVIFTYFISNLLV
jgi:hypothetical protein